MSYTIEYRWDGYIGELNIGEGIVCLNHVGRVRLKRKTHISKVLEGNNNRDQYDAEVKKILGDKTVLAWIMKYTMEEFKDYTIEEARECIEGTPEIATVRVRPGYTPEAIAGMANEDKVPGEGEITYDIRFYAITRDANHIKIIINVEAQKDFYPGYDIVTRAVFYCSRMLSAQLDVEFTPDNYDNIKKVYSVWICMNAPKDAEYTITRYRMCKESIYGQMTRENRYDLLEVIMICLGKDKDRNKGNKLHGMLSTLLSEELSPAEKEVVLGEEYGVETTVEMEGGMRLMCNLSELIEEKGVKKGLKRGREEGVLLGVLSLVSKNLLSKEVAAEELGLSVEELDAEMVKFGY